MIHVTVVSALGGLALGASFIEPRLGAFAFIAFALILPGIYISSYFRAYSYALLMGLVAFALANYWVYFFLSNLIGSPIKVFALFIVYLLYCANILGLLVLGLKFLYHGLARWFYLSIAPFYACCVFYFYPLVFQFNLGVTQVGFTDILQPISLLSHWSLSAFVILVNLIFAEVILLNQRCDVKTFLVGFSIVLVVFLSWFSIGYASRLIVEEQDSGKRQLTLGFHQPLDQSHLPVSDVELGATRTYTKEIASSYALADAGASLIVWPESEPKDVLKKTWVLNAYQEHARAMSADLLLQELTRVKVKPARYRNSSIFIDRNGRISVHDKMIRIPFGESMPQALNRGRLGEWMRRFLSGVYKEVVPGKKQNFFQHQGLEILPQICYELLDGQHLVSSVNAHPSVQVIIAQSNDNWFFSKRQVFMHNAFAILRAVETRRPILHVVNGGPSFVINKFGELQQQTHYRQAGAFLTQVTVDENEHTLGMLISPRHFIYLSAGLVILAFMFCFLQSFILSSAVKSTVRE